MIEQENRALADLPAGHPPVLFVVVDTEEEFDWGQPLARSNTKVESLDFQYRAQEIFDRHGLAPAYVMDYPAATSETAVDLFGGWLGEGRCEIGTHLHPWVSPPHEEEVNSRNSYACNLPAELEREKLAHLTDTITENFGLRPTVFRAGRFGFGPQTARTLEELGYEVDLSIVPRTSFAGDGGPDFRAYDERPFWFGEHRRLLEIPVSCGFAGILSHRGASLYSLLASRLGMSLHAPGVAARLGLVERIRMTPEGADQAPLKRLTRRLLAKGCRIFSLTYHSPSLDPGNTPYVRNQDDLREFLKTLDDFLHHFLDDLGGRPSTPSKLFRLMGGSSEPSPRVLEEPVQ